MSHLTRLSLVAASATVMLGLSACATPEQRLRNGFIEAGISRPVAGCLAQRMASRLSIAQLQRFGDAAGLRGQNIGSMPVDLVMHRARALGDPEILGVVTSSAAICAVTN